MASLAMLTKRSNLPYGKRPWRQAAVLSALALLLGCSSDKSSSVPPKDASGVDAAAEASMETGTPDAADSSVEPDVNLDADVIDVDADKPNPTEMADRMRQVVEKLSVDLFPRDWSHPDHLDEAASYISDELAQISSVPVEEQTFQVSGNTYRNVIATLGPNTTERVIVGAHYDAVSVTPGADDNASGVAGLLEVARLLATDTLPVRVDIVAFTLEEPPHFATSNMGSAQHANWLANDNVPVVAMFAIEMIGYYSDLAGSQAYPIDGLEAVYGDVGDFISVVGRTDQSALVDQVNVAMKGAMSLRVQKLAAPVSLSGVDFSDHRSYWAQGWPAVMITDTAFYRNLEYHKPGDTMDRLDFGKMVDVVLGLRAAVVEVAKPY